MIVINRVKNNKYSFALSDKDGIRHVAKALTFINPNIYAFKRKIEHFDKRKFTFPIGMLRNVKEYAEKKRLDCRITDYEYKFPRGIQIDDRMSGKYVHQQKAVKAFFKQRFGIIQVPTRGGKTFIAAEIIRIFLNVEKSGQVLFCVDNTTLFNQAIGDIKGFFERYGGIEIGEIKAGKIDLTERVTVAMIQTLQAAYRRKDEKQKQVNAYLKNLSFLIVDEVHDNCSDSKLKLFKRCTKLNYQLCLSATPYRSETYVQNLKLQAWSGDICYIISEETLRKKKVLSDYKVVELLVDHTQIEYLEELSDDYFELQKQLIFYSDVRNKILVQLIEIVQRLGLKTLVLFQSIEHGDALSRILHLPFISGRDKTERREEEKQRFLEAEGGVLLASNIFKKGVTLPACEVLINTAASVEAANTIQKKGRVLGATETKDRSMIIDFIDIYDAYFSEHSEARLDTYIDAIGEKGVGILDTSAEDCFSVLEKWIKKWFRIKD